MKEKKRSQKRAKLVTKKSTKEAFKKETVFSKNIEKYQDKLIDYDTPTGKAYYGFAKQPLMKNDNGIGFKGVLLQSENRALVQCSECGEWLKSLPNSHMKSHGITHDEYKEKYGLNTQTGLISDEQGNTYAKNLIKNTFEAGKVRDASNPEVKERMVQGFKEKELEETMEQKNRLSTCPEQLKHATVQYVRRFKRLPNNRAINRGGFSQATTLIRRFGSLNNAMHEYGLPTRYSQGSRVEFVFPDGTMMETVNGIGMDIVYQMMLDKCPILQE